MIPKEIAQNAALNDVPAHDFRFNSPNIKKVQHDGPMSIQYLQYRKGLQLIFHVQTFDF